MISSILHPPECFALFQNSPFQLVMKDLLNLFQHNTMAVAVLVISLIVIFSLISVLTIRVVVRKKTRQGRTQLSRELDKTDVELDRVRKLLESAEEHLRLANSEKEKLEHRYNNSVFGIITLSLEGEIRSVNQVAGTLLRGLDSTMPEKSLDHRLQPPVGEKIQKFLVLGETGQTLSDGRKQDAQKDFDELLSSRAKFARFDSRIKSDDGTLHDVEFAIQFDDGSQIFNMSIQDIGDRKAYEEYAAYEGKIESIEKLALSLSHDLNNIVGSIIGFATLLKKRLSPDTKEFHYANIIEDSAKRTMDLVKRVLGFSYLDTKEIEIIDLNKLVNEAAAEFTKTHVGKYAVVMSPSDQPAMVKVSTSQLKQVLAAILQNAAEAMENGGVINCSVAVSEKDGLPRDFSLGTKHCLIEIEDHGTGMGEAVRRRIFDPFFTTKREKKYTGLSLSASYNIIRHHNGRISVDSKPGIGTTVKIYLPQQFEKSKLYPILTSATAGVPDGTKVLVVDDEESFRQLGYDILTEQGYQVITASNGQQGLEALRENPDIRIVVLDMIMPVMGGKEACMEIRKMKRPPKVLICTGYSEVSDLESILGTYAESLLQKPYSTGDLIAAVGKLL